MIHVSVIIILCRSCAFHYVAHMRQMLIYRPDAQAGKVEFGGAERSGGMIEHRLTYDGGVAAPHRSSTNCSGVVNSVWQFGHLNKIQFGPNLYVLRSMNSKSASLHAGHLIGRYILLAIISNPPLTKVCSSLGYDLQAKPRSTSPIPCYASYARTRSIDPHKQNIFRHRTPNHERIPVLLHSQGNFLLLIVRPSQTLVCLASGFLNGLIVPSPLR